MNEDLCEFDEKGDILHYKRSTGYECWYKYYNKNKLIYFKDSWNYEEFLKWENNDHIRITKKEFEKIKRIEEEKEFNSRTKVSRFRLMDI